MTESSQKNRLALILVAIVAIVAIAFIIQPKRESSSLGRAVEDLAEGARDAADELKPHKTTGEKIGDAVKDIGDDIKDSSR